MQAKHRSDEGCTVVLFPKIAFPERATDTCAVPFATPLPPATTFVPSQLRLTGTDMEPMMFGLPNIIGAIRPYSSPGGDIEGAFLSEPGNSTASRGSGSGINILLDASSSSSIYGASNVVQPASQRFLACIKT